MRIYIHRPSWTEYVQLPCYLSICAQHIASQKYFLSSMTVSNTLGTNCPAFTTAIPAYFRIVPWRRLWSSTHKIITKNMVLHHANTTSHKTFSNAFSSLKNVVFCGIFLLRLFLRDQLAVNISSENGVAPNRRQAIIWTNADPIHWSIYVGDANLKHILDWQFVYISTNFTPVLALSIFLIVLTTHVLLCLNSELVQAVTEVTWHLFEFECYQKTFTKTVMWLTNWHSKC